jgi:predicted transcriptional regulator
MSKPIPADEEPSIFDEIDEEAEERAIREAEAAIREGRVISHEAVVRWLKSWGTPDELPPPKCGE